MPHPAGISDARPDRRKIRTSPTGKAGARTALVRTALGCAMALAAMATVPQAAASAGDGALRIGVTHIPPPPGPSDIRLYTPEGFDVLLARKIAAALDRPLELVEVDANEDDALAAGTVDVVLARRGDNDAQPEKTRIIRSGFRSAATVAMRTDTTIHGWDDLAGRTVCISRGNAEGVRLAEAYHANIRLTEAPARGLVQVRTGDCDAAIHDEVLLRSLFGETGWQKFSATLPPLEETELVALLATDQPRLSDEAVSTLARTVTSPNWPSLGRKWAENVAFEVYLDQDAPDCH